MRVTNQTAFLVDFLPVIRRTLTRTGFQVDHVQYYSDALKPWIARRERLGRFVLRRDPRDISRIWALDPDGGAYLAALAEYERSLINERAQAAREAAGARGKQVDRPKVVSPEQLRAAKQMRAAGESMATVCHTLGVKRSTLYVALSESGEGAA